MKSKNIFLEILKLIGIFILGEFLFICIYSSFSPENDDAFISTMNKIGVIFSFVLAISISTITNFNKVKKLRVLAESNYVNISVHKTRAEKLLIQANKVVDKYMIHESDVHTNVSEIRSSAHNKSLRSLRKITTSGEFKAMVENYPDLKANISVQQLIDQIANSENLIANSKLIYNDAVKQYNFMVESFPVNLMKRLWKVKPLEYYSEPEIEITDEMLGLE